MLSKMFKPSGFMPTGNWDNTALFCSISCCYATEGNLEWAWIVYGMKVGQPCSLHSWQHPFMSLYGEMSICLLLIRLDVCLCAFPGLIWFLCFVVCCSDIFVLVVFTINLCVFTLFLWVYIQGFFPASFTLFLYSMWEIMNSTATKNC